MLNEVEVREGGVVHYGQVLGQIPSWLKLGDVHLIDGVKVREVLGDWTHLPECDRPPAFILEDTQAASAKMGWDRSEGRPAVRCTLPGLPIQELRGVGRGACVILFNGPSLAMATAELWRLHSAGVPLVGMNRTHVGFAGYEGPQPDYLCLVDQIWFDSPRWSRSVLQHPMIINGGLHPAAHGYRVARHPRMAPFSWDLALDGFHGPVPCTTGFLALQFAAYAGFTDLYCFGLDMAGGHFDGTKASIYFRDALRHFARIAEAVEGRVRIWNCNPSSSCRSFPFGSPPEGVGGHSRPLPPPPFPTCEEAAS